MEQGVPRGEKDEKKDEMKKEEKEEKKGQTSPLEALRAKKTPRKYNRCQFRIFS